ncbi:hypothetical protein SAMN04488505_10727 [Chitinophaga rupis]|uniref:S-adenosylhomocysteine hydrolase n=1 Tax=Chitinophaga rupis TaxID=573321 RepID=A0A1H8C8N2_9BACT|nr:DUF6088 family protein [Chitinophaga rupis]SEM91249.1 hypothetical protein SAMN04488505_10727 [Chitinophaga rupis]
MKYKSTIEGKIAARIARMKSPVVLREDFQDLGGYDQVGRALMSLVSKGKLVRIGYGLYAKTRVSSVNGKILPAESLPNLAKKALARLGVQTVPTQAEKDYAEGRSTQIPTGRMIGVKDRVSRKITYNDARIYYERTTF